MKPALLLFALALSLRPCLLPAQKRDSIYDPKKEIIINDNRFKVYNSWISGGAGWAQNFSTGRSKFNLGADFNFHIKQDYFQLGFFLSGQRFGRYDNYDFHFCYGRRLENRKINFAWFAGLAFVHGYTREDSFYRYYNDPGLYVSAQLVKKLTYDVGAGIEAFGEVTPRHQLAGFRFIIYFSGAYKGSTKKHGPN
ncbi:MAG: hypothetical protein AB1458_03355 [Bacteroidota bacterium]